MSCYTSLVEIYDSVNKTKGFSFAVQNGLKESGELYNLFKQYNIDSLLLDELNSFINIMESPNYTHFEALRKISLHESDFIKIFSRFSYILSIYFDNKEAYRNFPLFFKECTSFYNINRYGNLSIGELKSLFNKKIYYSTYYDLNNNVYHTEIIGKAPFNYDKYNKYEKSICNGEQINYFNTDEFFVFSEYDTYLKEYCNIVNNDINNPKDYVKWVSRYHGDGYGYDILSYDLINNKEKLIEVKSGISNQFSLTKNEYRVMLNTINQPYSDYYIYRYYYNNLKAKLEFYVLKYDPNNNIFIDVNTNEIYYTTPYIEYDNNKEVISFLLHKEDEYKKLLQR